MSDRVSVKVWRGWLVLSCAWSASLKVECSLRRWAGGIPESTCKSSLRVGFRHPEMMRIVSFNETFHAALNVFESMAAEGASWNQVIESNCTHHDRLCFVFLVAASFVCRCFFWNIDVSQRNRNSQACACCKIVLFEIITLIQLGTIK